MCDWGTDIEVRLAFPNAVSGRTTVPVDACIADLVQRLNDAGVHTIGCCCGHRKGHGSILIEQGGEIIELILPKSPAPHALRDARAELEPRDEWRLDDRGCLDDVVVEDVATFRLERMSDDHVWGAVYRRDGSRTVFNLFGDRLSLTHEDDIPAALAAVPVAPPPQAVEDHLHRLEFLARIYEHEDIAERVGMLRQALSAPVVVQDAPAQEKKVD